MSEHKSDLVTLTGISKDFGVVRALRNVSIGFRAGEVLCLVGENGAGKSTLMRILEGEFTPDRGTVEVLGRPVFFRAPRDAHAAGIRVVHQEPEIIPELTVAENVFIGDYRSRGGLLDWGDLERRTRTMLTEFGLSGVLEPRQICLGLGPAQRQLIEIMRALRPGLKLLALDEPTSSLTTEESERLFALIARLKKSGVGIIYISHRLREVLALADRVAVLRDGQLQAVLPGGTVDAAEMMRLMVGRDVTTLFNRRAPRSPTSVALETQGLSTRFLTDINLSVCAGEVVGLAGLVGAGRSELARAIFGFDKLTGGRVLVSGEVIRLRGPGDAILNGLGFVPEDRKQEALLLGQSLKRNVSLTVPQRISRYGFVQERLEHPLVAGVVARLGVKTPSLEQAVGKLSGGNQQKVVFARWLVRAPKILILDEPTRGIDVGAKAEIYGLIHDLAASSVAILLISSELPEILGLTDRVLVMGGGRIVGQLDTEHATEEDVLRLAMTHHLEPVDGAPSARGGTS